jgi:hypothetical protein
LICYDEMGLDGIQTGQKWRRRRRTKARPHGSVNIVDSLRVRFRTVVFFSLCSLFKNKRERWSILKIKRCGHRHTKRVREEMRLRHSQGSRPASSRRRLSESHRLIFVFSVLLLDLFFFFGHLSLLMHFLVQNRRGEGGQDFEGVKIDWNEKIKLDIPSWTTASLCLYKPTSIFHIECYFILRGF